MAGFFFFLTLEFVKHWATLRIDLTPPWLMGFYVNIWCGTFHLTGAHARACVCMCVCVLKAKGPA